MSKSLDTILEKYVEDNKEQIKKYGHYYDNIFEESEELYLKRIKLNTKNTIYEEIKKEIEPKIKKEIEPKIKKEIQRKMDKDKLKEINLLVLSGLVLSFFVGLLVNQVTDVITYVKNITSNYINSTAWLIVILLIVCVFIAIILIFLQINKFIESKGEDDV